MERSIPQTLCGLYHQVQPNIAFLILRKVLLEDLHGSQVMKTVVEFDNAKAKVKRCARACLKIIKVQRGCNSKFAVNDEPREPNYDHSLQRVLQKPQVLE